MWHMPSLDMPNLAAIRYQTQIQRTPVGPSSANVPVTPSTTTPSPPVQPCSSCGPPGLNLSVEQGATLSSQLALTVKDANGNTQPLDITGFEFLFTAKTS